jgi:hypothetical protein
MITDSLERNPTMPTALSLVLTLVAIAMWTLALSSVDASRMTDIGIVSVLPAWSFAAFFILIVSFCLVISRQELNIALLVWHLIVLILFIHGMPIILYGTLRYSWAWKHIGIVDYISRHGSVDREIDTLSAYHNWPGFFALNALVTDITGLKTPVIFALWAPLFFNLLYLGTLPLILRSFTNDRRVIWMAVWIFFLTNWIGQDYFAPQAYGYFLYLVILAVCLRWFGVEVSARKRATGAPILHRFRVNYDRLLRHTKIIDPSVSKAKPYQRVGLMGLILLLAIAVVTSHQLTPFMMICSLSALILFRCSSARGLPALLVVLNLAWIFYAATPFIENNIQSVAETIGKLLDNLDSNFIDTSVASSGHRLVALTGRALTVFLWSLALVGGIRRLLTGRLDLSAAILAISPFVMLGGSAYGGEILFRVYFFSLPFMAFFAALVIYPSQKSERSWKEGVLVVMLSSTLLTGLLFAHFGKDRHYHFTRNEVDASKYLYNSAGPHSLLIEGSRNYPSQFKNYEYFTYVPIDREPPKSRENVIGRPVETLSRWMGNSKFREAYFIITRSMKVEMNATGRMPPLSLYRIERSLLESPEFIPIFENEDARVFTLLGNKYGDGADE